MLLSIIIPTKRSRLDELSRQAILSALQINAKDIEVILHVDDDVGKETKGVNVEQFTGSFQDSRLKCFVHPQPLTMTQNWAKAIVKALGDYLIVIGDDDAMRPEAYNFAHWAKENKLDAILAEGVVQYYWPSYPSANSAAKLVGLHINGKIEYPDIHQIAMINSYGPKMPLYSYQPEIYHGLIGRDALERMKQVTGKYVGSVIPDLYFAFAIAPFIQKYAMVKYPFSLPGYSMKGNSGKFKKNAISIEDKNLQVTGWPSNIPNTRDFVSLYAKCKWDAYHDSGQQELVKNMRPYSTYAQCFLNSPHTWFRLIDLWQQFRMFLKESGTSFFVGVLCLKLWIGFHILVRINLKMPYVLHVFERRHNVIYKKKPDFCFKADTISEANKKLDEWLTENKLTLPA